MATTIYKVKELTLLDGTDVTVKPLSIKDQRKATRLLSDFSKRVQSGEFDDADEVDVNDAFMDTLIEVAKLAFAKTNPELLEKDDDYLLDVLDTLTLTEVVKIAANWSFDADNPKEAENPLIGRS